jgi:hypothetical protein
MLRRFERLGPKAEVEQHLALVCSSINTGEKVFYGTGCNFFSDVHAATEHQFACGDELAHDLRSSLAAVTPSA